MLKGQAKTDYQRDYMRRRRGSNKIGLTGSNKPTLDELRGLISGIEAKQTVQPTVPLYNPILHRAGDRVLVQQGKRLVETVIPELDAGGSPMPEYT